MSTYQGLVNEGATCYLNSLIQTLYMTYEFRENVYAYQHDPKKIPEKDSIPYQLQKLFVNLQIKDKPSYTRGLLKSFQWTDAEAFQQHDVQQFCRKLFQAIQKTHKNTSWIKQLFEGSMNSYVDCGKHKSIREEGYMDIALPIRNPYTKETYKSIEESLSNYLKPQKLEDKFQCQGCGQRVFVEKGMSLAGVPPILTLQLNRFELNYETFQRQKINSFFYYPEILELHRFMVPHNQIKIKDLPKDIQIKTITLAKPQNPRTINFENLQADKTRPRKKSDDQTVKKQVVTYFDEQNKDKRAKELKELSKQDEKLKNLQILADLKHGKEKFDKKMQKIKEKDQYDLDNDVLFGMGAGAITNKDWNMGSFEKPNFEKSQIKYQHEEEAFDPNKEYPDLTYALYAVLVHSGGSYGGHYFAYISDGTNWFKFDDATVTKVSKAQIRKYGVNSNSNYGTNAYLLFYRDVKTFKNLNKIEIPVQLLEKVKIEEEKAEEIRKIVSTDKNKRLLQLNQTLLIKVFQEGISDPYVVSVKRQEETINTLRVKIKEYFNIQESDENWRLRRYNKTDDSMYQVYDSSDLSFEQLDIREQIYLTIEFKASHEVFQEYNPKKITVKINVWKQGIIMIPEKKLKPTRIRILDEETFEDLYKAIVKATGIQSPLILRRNFSGSNPITKLTLQGNKIKKLIEMRFFNNIVLYVQEQSSGSLTKWQQEFQNERYRCLIKFNNPKIEEEKKEQIYFDTRKTLGELKEELSKLINIPSDHFRIKKGKNSLAEITTFKKKLIDLKFIGTEFLFLEEGLSSKGSVIVHRGQVGLVNDRIEFNVFQELQFEIGNDLVTISDLCKKISQSTGIPQQNIRIRQYKNFEFKEIFTQSDELQRIRERSLVWQLIEGELPKGLQIYYRVFDIMNFEFGPLKNLYADTSSSYQELAYLIEQDTGIPHNKILVWKPLSNYIQKQNMLDCQWIEIRYLSTTLREDPLMVRCDGDIIIIKEAEKEYDPPKNTKKTAETSTKAKGEAQLTITVIAQNQEPEMAKDIEKPKEVEKSNDV